MHTLYGLPSYLKNTLCSLLGSTLCMILQNVVRDVVVEDVSGLTMALTPVFNCNL